MRGARARSAAEAEAGWRREAETVSSWCRNDRMALIGSGQRLEERDNGIDFLLGEILVKLGGSHLPHGLGKCRGAAVVKIRRCRSDIAQTGHTQDLRLGRGKRMQDAMPLIEIAADVDALM